MKILITGCSGFIGSNLCEKLIELNNFIVYGIDINDLPSDFKNKNKIVFMKEDINTPELTSIKSLNPDIVIHLAALAGVSESCNVPQKYIDANIKGTINLIENCIKYNVKKIIYASSSSIYGNTENIDVYNTTDTLQSPYSITKKCCEMLFDYYARFYNLNIVGLRFFSVYGPRCRKDMAPYIFINSIINDKNITINGDGSVIRDFTYIDDIVDGIIKSIEYVNKNNKIHEIFNLGNGNPITINEFINKIENILNKKAKIIYGSPKKHDNLKTCADLKKSFEKLNYIPTININTGLTLTIDKFT
jgi:UDP-glucuronate 4-epimerase